MAGSFHKLTYWLVGAFIVGMTIMNNAGFRRYILAYNSATMTNQVHTRNGSVTEGRVSASGYSQGKPSVDKRYNILWYKLPNDFKNHPGVVDVDFSHCEYSNCEMQFNTSERMNSDAVLFDGRFVSSSDYFQRPAGQVWVFSAHEAPVTYDVPRGSQWRKAPWRNSFNWTMTYNKNNTDIHLPYGILRRKAFPDKRNYTFIASKKTNGALIISSHCPTRSKRENYVKELSKYIPVTVLGACGTPWDCGRRYIHDSCFDLLNTTYKFYLAFEHNMRCAHNTTPKNYLQILIMTQSWL